MPYTASFRTGWAIIYFFIMSGRVTLQIIQVQYNKPKWILNFSPGTLQRKVLLSKFHFLKNNFVIRSHFYKSKILACAHFIRIKRGFAILLYHRFCRKNYSGYCMSSRKNRLIPINKVIKILMCIRWAYIVVIRSVLY